jgi:hypothetical protein
MGHVYEAPVWHPTTRGLWPPLVPVKTHPTMNSGVGRKALRHRHLVLARTQEPSARPAQSLRPCRCHPPRLLPGPEPGRNSRFDTAKKTSGQTRTWRLDLLPGERRDCPQPTPIAGQKSKEAPARRRERKSEITRRGLRAQPASVTIPTLHVRVKENLPESRIICGRTADGATWPVPRADGGDVAVRTGTTLPLACPCVTRLRAGGQAAGGLRPWGWPNADGGQPVGCVPRTVYTPAMAGCGPQEDLSS